MAFTPLHKTGYYYLIAAHSGKPLGVSGVMLKQRDFRTAKPEEIRFAFYPAGPYIHLSPVADPVLAHCFAVEGESMDDKAGLVLRSYEGNRQHTQFRFMPVSGGGYRIMAAHSRKFLDVYVASKEDKAAVVQHSLSGGRNQVFFVYYITEPVLENNRLALGERNRWDDLLPRMARADKAEGLLLQLNQLMQEGFPHAAWRLVNEPQHREHKALREARETVASLCRSLEERNNFDFPEWLNGYGTPDHKEGALLEDAVVAFDLGTLALLLWYACYLHADYLPPASSEEDNRSFYARNIRTCLHFYRNNGIYTRGKNARRETVEEYVSSRTHENFRRKVVSKAIEGKGEWAQEWECLVIDYHIHQEKHGYADHDARADFAVKQYNLQKDCWSGAMLQHINTPRRHWPLFEPGGITEPDPPVSRQAVMGIYGGMYGHHALRRPAQGNLMGVAVYSRKGGSVTGLGLMYEGEEQETLYGQKGDHVERMGVSGDEYFNSVFGFGKDIIDCLCIATNKGRIIAGGHFHGRDTAFGFSVDLPDGLEARLIGIEGHHNVDCIEQLSFVWEYMC